MKKTVVLLFVLSILLVSCGYNTPINSSASVSEPTVSRVIESANILETSVSEINEVTQITNVTDISYPSHTLSTTSSSINNVLPHVGEYLRVRDIPFKKFYKYNKTYRKSNTEWYIHNGLKENIQEYNTDFDFVVFTIVGYTGETLDSVYYNSSKYYIQINNSQNCKNDNKIHTIGVYGTPDEQCYGYPMCEIGGKYIAFITFSYEETVAEKDDFGFIDCYFKIEEKDGVEWVYPNFYFDFSYLKCAVKIEDQNENFIYKPHEDDDIIKYMDENGIPNATFDYKCELNAFIEEMTSMYVVDTKNINPVGDYTSILNVFQFEGFAGYSDDVIDVVNYVPTVENNVPIIVTILGFAGEEISEDGYYSYYYVYAEPYRFTRAQCYDDTVYLMKAYGSPSHPYFGQRRIEIGDRYLRLETDKSFFQTNETLTATKMFYIINGDSELISFAVPDFGTDFSNITETVRTSFKITKEERCIYKVGRDDDVIQNMYENGIDPPEYSDKAWLDFFVKQIFNL